MSGYLQKPGGGGGVTDINGLTGAVTLSEGSGIFFDTTGNDIAINAIGSTVPSDTSLAVKVATTAALPGTPTYDNGTAGVGATLTRSSNGTTGTIDGVTAANLMAGDYILVKNQAAQLQNGVYEVTQQGTASLPYILTRVTEADTTAELDDLVVTAALGSTNKGVPYGQQTNNPTIGVSNIVFTATGIYMRQQTTGTQAINQIPVYTGTALTQTKGTANFKYNPTTDLFTIRGIDYTFPANNGDASQVLTTDGSGTLSWAAAGGAGSPAGSNNQIQINQSGSFFADNKFQKSDTGFNVGLNHTQQSAVAFTGSGLDDLTVSGTFSGTYPTTYTVTVAGTGTPDTFDWTDGTNSGTGVSMDTSPITLSNGVEISFGTDTGHTLTESWTWTYSNVNQNVLDFSNNDYKFQSTFGTDTFGYQISDNLLGFGLKGSANTYVSAGGDIVLSGIIDSGGMKIGNTLQLSTGEISEFNITATGTDLSVGDGVSNETQFNITSNTFSLLSDLSAIEYGISQSVGAVTLGNLTGGNNTKITIDDVNEHITISNLPAYDDDTAAGVGGLTAGMVYMTTGSGSAPLNVSGILMIKQ